LPTPTSRTLKLLRDEKKVVNIVEYWNSFTRQRKDLFGFIDIIALDLETKKTWGVQCTSTSNMSARVKKICTECTEYSLAWLKSGNHIEVIGWAKKAVGKGKRLTWQPTRRVLTLEDVDV